MERYYSNNKLIPVFYTLVTETQEGNTTAWFSPSHLPEPLSYISYLSLLRHISPNDLPYAKIVETVFSAVFYTYMWSSNIVRGIHKWLEEPLMYTVTTTPFRKFRAALPWLSTECRSESFLDSICAELLFALFYIYDDVLDHKTMRYGRPTSFGKFGAGSLLSWHAAHTTEGIGEYVLEGDKERIELWHETLSNISKCEHERTTRKNIIPLVDYCEHSISRTRFLGMWWERSAKSCKQAELSNLIAEVYPTCALAGQLRNDLRNIDDREKAGGGIQFSDFTEGKITAITLTTLNMACIKDRDWILDQVWGKYHKLSDSVIDRLRRICFDSGAVNMIKELLVSNITTIENAVNDSQLHPAVKLLWQAWIYRQFRVNVTAEPSEFSWSAKTFIEGVSYLSQNIAGKFPEVA
jgi:geranylgeranyl pyrophosphate synthase